MSQNTRGIDPHYLLAKPGGLNISSPVPLPSTNISHPNSPAGTSPRLAPRAQSHFDSRPISPRPGSLSLASFITATAEEHGESPYARDPNAPPLIPPPKSPRFKDIFTTPRTEEEGMDSPWTRASKKMARARAAKKDLEGKDEEGDEEGAQFENVSYNFNGNRESNGGVGLGIGSGGGEKDGLGFGGTTSGWENEGGARGWGGRNLKMLWCLAIIGLLGAALGVSLGLTLRSRNAFRNAIEDQAANSAPLTPVSSGFVLSSATTSRPPPSSIAPIVSYAFYPASAIQVGTSSSSSPSPTPSFASISASSTSSSIASPTTLSSSAASSSPLSPTRILAPSPTSPPSYTQTSYIYALSGVTTTVSISYTLPAPSLLQIRPNGQYQFTQQVTLPSLGVGVVGSFVSDVRFRVMPVPTRAEGKQRMRGRRDGEKRRERWRKVSVRSD